MTLYASLQQFVSPAALQNDSQLYLAGFFPFNDVRVRNRLSDQAGDELLSSLSYWQGQYDSAQTEDAKKLVAHDMLSMLSSGFNGAARGVITEPEFLERIGVIA